MSGTNWKMPEVKQELVKAPATTSPTARSIKQEPPKINISPCTVDMGSGPPSPTPSCTTVLLGSNRQPQPQISVRRDLSEILEQDDQVTVVNTPRNSTRPVSYDPSDWRLTTRRMGDRLKHIFDTSVFSDVTFKVGIGDVASMEEIPAHKLILRMASPIFDDMLKEAEKNVNNNAEQNVVLSIYDIQPSVFKILLKFIYYDKFDKSTLDSETIFDIMKASNTYGLKQLYLSCVKSIKRYMTDEIALQLCELDACYGDLSLHESALTVVAKSAERIFKMKEFSQLSEQAVIAICSRDDLRIDERALFEAVVTWGWDRCDQKGMVKCTANLRIIMANILPEIRFPLMKMEDISLVVGPTQILTRDEKLPVYEYLSVKDPEARKKLQINMPFKTTPRANDQDNENNDSSSSSDCREAVSASPEQTPRIMSVPIISTEYMDALTGHESETASNVSGFSEPRHNTKTRISRSGSQSSGSSSTKRRKLEKEKKPKRVRIEKRRNSSPDPEDTFEEVTRISKRGNVELNKFVYSLSQNELRSTIEVIELKNATVVDSKHLNLGRVPLRKLNKFIMNIVVDDDLVEKGKLTDNTMVDQCLFFDLKPPRMDRLWKTRIDINIVINKIVQLCMDHKNRRVVLNNFNRSDGRSIISSLRDEELRSLVLYDLFSDKIPVSLNKFVLLRIEGCPEIINFIKNMKHLKELSVVFLRPSQDGQPPVTLSFDSSFLSKDKICSLSLGWINLTLEPSVRYYNLKTLALYCVTWDQLFEERFHLTFPKLQELYFMGVPGSCVMKGSTRFLKNILTKLDNLSTVVVCRCPFFSNGDEQFEVKAILEPHGLNDVDNNFSLERVSAGSKEWKGRKVTVIDLPNYCYSKLGFENVFTDLPTYNSS